MLNYLKKIAFTLGIASCFTLLAPSFLYAQKFNPQSASDFAATHGGKDYANALEGVEQAETLCGDKNTLCEIDETCLKCTTKYEISSSNRTSGYSAFGYTISTKGICVKGDISSVDISKYHSDCPNGTLTVEPLGFLSSSSGSGLVYNPGVFHGFKDGEKEYRLSISEFNEEGNIKIEYNKESFAGCEVMPVKLYNMKKCFFCPLSALIFETANKVAYESFQFFGNSFQILIVIIWAIWLAYTVLQQIFPLTKQDAPKFLSSVLKQSFKFFVAYLLLTHYKDIFRYFIVPVLNAGIQLGISIQTIGVSGLVDEVTEYSSKVSEGLFNSKLEANDISLYEEIEKYLASLQASLAYMQVIGTTLFCIGSHMTFDIKTAIKGAGIEHLKDGLRIVLLGSILTLFAFILIMAFAFYFLDGLLQLIFIGAMLPLMIAGWPFKITAQYASTGFKMLLNTFFIIFFTGFVVSVNVELINQSMIFSQSIQSTTNGVTAEGFDAIVDAINSQNEDNLKTATDIGGAGFMLLIFCCVFGFKFVKEVTPLAETLSAGGGMGIASKIGTMGASAVKGVASKATAPVRKATTDAIKSKIGKGMGKLKTGAGNFLQNAARGKSGIMARAANAMGRGLKESAAKNSGGN